jgi:hypothetical protein
MGLGVLIEGCMQQENGQFHSIEWTSGHAEIGMGVCGKALKVVYVTAC